MVDFAWLNSPEGREEINRRREERRVQEKLESKTLSFTGHRPNKLGNCYSLTDKQSIYIKNKIEPVLIDLIKNEELSALYPVEQLGLTK